MQKIPLRDLLLPGVIAVGAIIAMALEYQVEGEPGLAIGVFAGLLGVLLLWLSD